MQPSSHPELLLSAIVGIAIAHTLPVQADIPVIFEDRSETIGFIHRSAEDGGLGLGGAAWFDFNNDGHLDLYLPNGRQNPNALYRNAGNDNGWVKIELEGTTSNRDAIGARVRVVAGDLAQTKGLYAGSSFMSTDSSVLNFGLASNKATEFIQVRWPSGLIEDFANLPAGARVRLVEGTSTCCAGDVDRSGAVDIIDLLTVLANWGPCAGAPTPCPADLDESGDVDFVDLLEILANWTV